MRALILRVSERFAGFRRCATGRSSHHHVNGKMSVPVGGTETLGLHAPSDCAGAASHHLRRMEHLDEVCVEVSHPLKLSADYHIRASRRRWGSTQRFFTRVGHRHGSTVQKTRSSGGFAPMLCLIGDVQQNIRMALIFLPAPAREVFARQRSDVGLDDLAP